MKRLFIFALIFLLGFLMAGCNTSVPPVQSSAHQSGEDIALQAFCVDTTDGTGASVREYALWSAAACTSHVDETASKTKTVVFEGKQYTGEYSRSMTETYNTYQTDFYSTGQELFCVNAETGELTDIILPNNGEGNMDADACQEIAFNLADKYIDRSEYTLTVSSYETSHGYLFTKYIDGIETNEKLSIGIKKNGKISVFSHSMLGAFPANEEALSAANAQRVTLLADADAKTLAMNKAAEVCPDGEKKLTDRMWVMLENGQIGMIYTITVTEKSTNGDTVDIEENAVDVLVK